MEKSPRILTAQDITYTWLGECSWFIESTFQNCDFSKIDLMNDICKCKPWCKAKLIEIVNFNGTNIKGSILPPFEHMLKFYWGCLSNKLTTLCMAYDASKHPNPKLFNDWANGGKCPYIGIEIEREIRFSEHRKLWDPNIKAPEMKELVKMLIREKCVDSDFHERVEK